MKTYIFLLMMFFFLPSACRAMDNVENYEQARLDYIANLACIASYNDDFGEEVRREIRHAGYKIDSVSQFIDDVKIKYHLIETGAAGAKTYILAIAGTEDASDREIDVAMGKVNFAGSTPEEFAANAAQEEIEGKPAVHRGFERYAQKAFFSPNEQGDQLSEFLVRQLAAAPDNRLCIVGHSLGGAVATIGAARLVDLGVPPEKVQVISFGAPEVGNQAFADRYGSVLNIRRITMQGDIVKHLLNAAKGNYRHVGREVKWERDDSARGLNHSIYVYFDRALRNYYASQDAYCKEKTPEKSADGAADIYVLPLHLELPENLEKDRSYIERSVKSVLSNSWRGSVLFADENAVLEEALAQAQRAGAKYVLKQSVHAVRVRDKRKLLYDMSTETELYDTAEKTLAGYYQTSGTSSELSPLVLAMHQTVQIDADIHAKLEGRLKEEQNDI